MLTTLLTNGTRSASLLVNGLNALRRAAAAIALVAAGAMASGACGQTITDTGSGGATVNGSLGANEYGPGNTYTWLGGGTSFGGPLGAGSIYMNSDTSTLYVAYQLGATLNDSVVVLLDTGSSSPATYPGNSGNLGDENAITRLLNFGTTLPSGFRASFAIVFGGANQGSGERFYIITSSSVNFSGSFAGSGAGNNPNDVREVSIPYALLGISPGASVKFLATLGNPNQGGGASFLSSETIPPNPAFNAATQPGQSGGTFTNAGQFNTYCLPISGITGPSDPPAQCPGATVSFTVSVAAGSSPQYLWRKGGNNLSNAGTISGATSPTLTITGIVAGDSGAYDCLVSNGCSPSTPSSAATLTVNASTMISVQPPSTASQCAGFSTSFGLTATGTALTYLWQQSLNNGGSWDPAAGVNTNASYSTDPAAATGTLFRCIVSGACPSATSNVVTLTVTPGVSLTVNMQLQGVTTGTFTRCITIDLYTTASCPNPAFTTPQTVTFTNGLGSATVSTGACTTYIGAAARDPRHTLRRVGTAMPYFDTSNPNNLVATFTVASGKPLIGGNANDDPFIDILDFGGYIGQSGLTIGASTTCPPTGLHTDFSGNGSVGTEDFTFIQSNFFAPRDADPCGNPLSDGLPVTDISVADLVARGDWDIARGDLNHDGRLNAADVTFAAAHGLPACVADFNGLNGVNVQDIFDFITSWMAGQPAADVNRDGRLSVQDLFDFLTAWFGGC